MKSIHKILFLVIVTLSFLSCQDTIYVDLPDTEPKVVIEGHLINKSSDIQNFVRLSFSSKNSSTNNIEQIHGAIVYIEDENGLKDTLRESWEYNGVYRDSLIKAELGKSYKLHVEINGKTYESSFEKMAPQNSIDSAWGQNKNIYAQKDFLPPLDSTYFVIVEYEKTTSTIGYSRWQIKRDEDFKSSVFTKDFTIDDDELTAIGKIEGRPLFLGSFEEGTLKVERYSLNRDAYDFWLGLETQLSSGGSPFDSPPAPLFTNLANINDEREQVLGYFTISQLNEYLVVIEE